MWWIYLSLFSEEQQQAGVEEDFGAGGAVLGTMFGNQQHRQPHSKLIQRKHVSTAYA